MASGVLDFKKEYRDLYMPKAEPGVIEVPDMLFIMVDGRGDPNAEGGEYQQAVELLYGLSYAIKMSKMGGKQPEGYFEYVVPPLEGLWWLDDDSPFDPAKKEKLCWTSMVRQPEFVTQEVFDRACRETAGKKPRLDTSKARLQSFREGLCVQMMHRGPFDDEPETVAKIDAFLKAQNYRDAISEVLPGGMVRRHHEIYLSDPRRTEPSKMKTVLRHPVK